jgi:hypothetical protein
MKLYLLVVPDDHGGVGVEQVGVAIDFDDGSPVIGVWLIDPNTDTWDDCYESSLPAPLAGVSMGGAFPNLRGLADFTKYAVTETDGTLVYQPEGVFRYARRDPTLWLL